MKYLIYAIVGLIAAVVALAVYVRVAPLRAADWHSVELPVGAAGASTGPGSHTVIRDVANAQGALAALDAIITATHRTARVAGSVADGRVTFVTRSRIFGFPDYTTVEARPDSGQIVIHGRLRFGQSDLGVNRARVDGWLAQFDAETPAL